MTSKFIVARVMNGGFLSLLLALLAPAAWVVAESPAQRVFGGMLLEEPTYEIPDLWKSPGKTPQVSQASHLQELEVAELSTENPIQLPYSTPIQDKIEEEPWVAEAWATPAFPITQALEDEKYTGPRTDWRFAAEYLMMRRGEPDHSTPLPLEYGPQHGFRFTAQKFDNSRERQSTQFVFQRVAGSDPFRLNGAGNQFVEQEAKNELLDFQIHRVFSERNDEWSTSKKIGLRAISLRDKFRLQAQSNSGNAQLEGYSENFLLGLNGGFTGTWHSNNLYVGGGVGAGLYGNLANSEISEAGTVRSSFDVSQIAVSADFDLVTGIQFTEQTALEVGYQGLVLMNVLTSADQEDFVNRESGIVLHHGLQLSLSHHF